jgi:hypothetical protein
MIKVSWNTAKGKTTRTHYANEELTRTYCGLELPEGTQSRPVVDCKKCQDVHHRNEARASNTKPGRSIQYYARAKR